MAFLSIISVFITLFILCFSCLIRAQQPYIGLATTDCNKVDVSNSDSALGYSCNGLNRSCEAYLTFRSQPPFNTVASISTLLSSDQSQLSLINSVSETATFETNKLVIVPVNCSCSGQFSQSNTSYTIQNADTYLFIANNTFQALSTCQAMEDQNGSPTNLVVGERLNVPLRCACPTKNQTSDGFQFLLSYLVAEGDSVSIISSRFGVDSSKIFEANSLSGPDIFFFTTLLIPLQNQPTVSQTIEPPSSNPVVPPPPPNSSSGEESNKTWIYVVAGILGGIALVLIFGSIIFYKFFHRKKNEPDSIRAPDSFEAKEKPLNKLFDEDSHQDLLESISGVAQSLKVYSFKELQSATDNFSSSYWIKGSVYRGKINGDFAAIKKVNGDVSKEITLLNKISHSNVIRLSGFCFNEGTWYLVYEFAVNGTLGDWIFGNKNEAKFLDWTQRIQIALDMATGLNYLHSFTNPPHVHKDLSSSNVLLDSDFRAKIANFALARPTEGQEGDFALTRHIVGTQGYMAPEYLENGLVSTKVDVYAFGVLMIELLTGKEAAAVFAEGKNKNLSDILNAVFNKEDGEQSLRHFIDPLMHENYPVELALLLVSLIDSCLNKNPSDRPAMYEIEHSLSSILSASLNL